MERGALSWSDEWSDEWPDEIIGNDPFRSARPPLEGSGKLAAMHEFVTGDFDARPLLSSSAHAPDVSERPSSESPAFVALRGRIAGVLHRRATHIAARWEEQSRMVALREPGGGVSTVSTGSTASAGGTSGTVQRDQRSTVAALVASLANALAAEGATSDDLVTLGLAVGRDAFERGGSMHHAFRGLDLLSAMLLYAMEETIAEEEAATAADGVRLSRRLHQATSLLTLAATRGYTQAMGNAMRGRFRYLRHDLRNPLGTIKNVLAMMDDETIPLETRMHARFRAMAKRNVHALGDLIAERLSDMAAVHPALPRQNVSLHTIACAVRRVLRAEADARETKVIIASAEGRVILDAGGFELLLHELLYVALHETTGGDELHLEFADVQGERAAATLFCVPPRPLVREPATLERLTALARHVGGELEVGVEEITLSMPVLHVEEGSAQAWTSDLVEPVVLATAADISPAAGAASGGGQAGYDLRRTSESENGQPRPL
jgi:signal transduction histidine kinase